MNAIETELEKAIRERNELEERFRVGLWSVVLVCLGLMLMAVFS